MQVGHGGPVRVELSIISLSAIIPLSHGYERAAAAARFRSATRIVTVSGTRAQNSRPHRSHDRRTATSTYPPLCRDALKWICRSRTRDEVEGTETEKERETVSVCARVCV